MKRLTRTLAAAAGVAAAALVLAGCAGSPNDSGGSSDGKTLTIAVWDYA